jgi:hypothetical protein
MLILNARIWVTYRKCSLWLEVVNYNLKKAHYGIMYFLVNQKVFQYFAAYFQLLIIISYHLHSLIFLIKKIVLTGYKYEFYFNLGIVLIKLYNLLITIFTQFIFLYSNHFDIQINEFF